MPIALILAGISAPLLTPGIAQAQDPAGDVRGGAQAIAVRLVPYVGVPGLSGALGITTAQVDSGTAAASAGATDLGLAGTLVNALVPGEEGKESRFQLPEPISAASGRVEQVERYPLNPPDAPASSAGAPGWGAHESATATEDPLAALGSVTALELNIPGVLRITGGTSRSAADAARSIGEVTLGQLALGDNVVELSGLRWSAAKATGKDAVQSFTLGSMTVSGTAMPVGSGQELAAAFEAANKALEPTGLSIGVPQVVGTAREAAVAPLVLQLRSPQALVEPGAQAGEVTKPLLLGVAKAVLDAYPDAAAAQIVLNALVGASSGRSGGRLEFGGVSARSDLLPAVDTGTGSPAVVPPSVPALPPVTNGDIPAPVGTLDPPPVVPVNDGITAVDVTQGDLRLGSADMRGMALPAQPAVQAADVSGRGKAAVALGVGLALLLAFAAVDRLRAG